MANLKIVKISDLPELTSLNNGMTTILAYDKQNYLLDVSKIKGKKIVDIAGLQSSKSGEANTIIFKFDDGTSYSIKVYNGHDGQEGLPGGEGDKGNQGEDAEIKRTGTNYAGITDVLYIVNNTDTQDPTLPWSAYRGIDMNTKIYELNETFLTEEEYERLFNDEKFIIAEFVTKTDNQSAILFNNDYNPHIVYKKYWTYEDSGLDTYYIYNPISGTYDAISADLWKDIYLGATSGYFLITSSMEKDDTDLYYFDKSDLTYKPVTKVQTIVGYEEDEAGNRIKDENDEDIPVLKYLGNKEIKNYYLDEIDAFIDAEYSVSNKKWTFNLVTGPKGEIIPEIYTSIDGIDFTKLTDEEVLDIDVNSFNNYYYKTDDEYVKIDNIKDYLSEKQVRYYKLDENREYYEVTEGDISEDNLDEYIIVTKNPVTGVYTYERHYIKEVYGEPTYFVDELTLSSIDLYYYTDDRTYYTRSIITIPPIDEEHEATSEEVYTAIVIPSWIYAEFTTNDEDITALILNANEGLGEEDNIIIDDTIDDGNSYVETKSIIRIVPGVKENLYRKNPDGTYILVNLNKDEIYSSSEYYILTDEFEYKQISGEYALSNGITQLYTINVDNEYESYYGSIIEENSYYVKLPIYEKVENPIDYLSVENLTLFYGEPKLLPITIYPENNLRSYVIIEYDPERITFFEDGRIAATNGNNFTTQIRIKSVENPEICALINVRLTTPVKEITLDENNVYEVNIGESTIIKYTVGPDNAENHNIIWTSSDPESVLVEPGDEPNTVKLTGLKRSRSVNIIGESEDGFGKKITFTFEVIQVAERIYWDQEDIIYHEPVYYTQNEVIAYNVAHRIEIENGELPELTTNDIKVQGYYTLVGLLFKDIILSPVVEPEDTSYPQIIWESTDYNIANVVEQEFTIVDQEKISHLATQADIDNNLATELGEEVIDQEYKSHKENKYVLKSSAVGEIVIKGTVERYEDLFVEVSVRIDQSVEQINVYPDNLSINVNTNKKLIAEILPDNDKVQKNIEWISSNENIIEVSPTGTITAKNPGNTTVIARALDGSGTEGMSTITVTIPAKDIILSGEDINGIVYVGINKTTTITAEIIYNANYAEGTKLGINWSVADNDIASIDENGVVTGLSIGNTTVLANAKDGSGVFGTIKLQVIKLVENISFELTQATMELGDTLVLIPNVLPDDASNGVVIWTSSDDTVAKVKQSGIVYAISSGNCTITATTTDGTNLTATCEITVAE